MAAANLALRFLLELAGIAALAYWGWRTGANSVTKIGLAVVAPVVLIVVWAFVVAPGAENPIPALVRVLIGSVLLLVAAGALAVSGQRTLAIVLALLVVANTILMLVFAE